MGAMCRARPIARSRAEAPLRGAAADPSMSSQECRCAAFWFDISVPLDLGVLLEEGREGVVGPRSARRLAHRLGVVPLVLAAIAAPSVATPASRTSAGSAALAFALAGDETVAA